MHPNALAALLIAAGMAACQPQDATSASHQSTPAIADTAAEPAAADADAEPVPGAASAVVGASAADAAASMPEDANAGAAAAAAGSNAIQTARRIRLLGTEPFWSIDISGTEMHYTTPDNDPGEHFQVERELLADGGVRYTGEDGITAFSVEVTPGACSDGMSDETYAYRAEFQLGRQIQTGCGRITVP